MTLASGPSGQQPPQRAGARCGTPWSSSLPRVIAPKMLPRAWLRTGLEPQLWTPTMVRFHGVHAFRRLAQHRCIALWAHRQGNTMSMTGKVGSPPLKIWQLRFLHSSGAASAHLPPWPKTQGHGKSQFVLAWSHLMLCNSFAFNANAEFFDDDVDGETLPVSLELSLFAAPPPCLCLSIFSH